MSKILSAAFASLALVVAPIALATAAAADDSTPANNPRVDGIKGSPNANGFGKQNGDAALNKADDTSNSTTSAKDLKGPPNANGYNKQ